MDSDIAINAIKRELLGTCIISIPQPRVMKDLTTPDGVPYKQFGVPVAGGYINFHLFDETQCQTRGKRIWVRAEVKKKTMPDCKEFLYVDLYPTEERLTHDRKIFEHSKDVPAELPEGSMQFDTYGHIHGSLVFVPHLASDE